MTGWAVVVVDQDPLLYFFMVDSFCYLVSLVTSTNSLDADIQVSQGRLPLFGHLHS